MTISIYPTNWLDSMVPPTVFRTGGTSLTFADVGNGIYLHRFDTDDVIHFSCQFNHGIKAGAIIKPHVHLVNGTAITGTALPQFTLKWTWANINAVFPGVNTDAAKTAVFTNAGAYKHVLADFADITPTANQSGISSIFMGSLERLDEGYETANIYLLGFDIHYENDTIGSYGSGTK